MCEAKWTKAVWYFTAALQFKTLADNAIVVELSLFIYFRLKTVCINAQDSCTSW